MTAHRLLITALAVLSSLSANAALRWEPLSAGPQADTLLAIDAWSQPQPICQAELNGGLHPGKFRKGACHASWGGRESAADKFKVLAGQARDYRWLEALSEDFKDGKLPSRRVFIAGREADGRPLPLCRVVESFPGDREIYVGKVVGERCLYANNGREDKSKRFQVLIDLSLPSEPEVALTPEEMAQVRRIMAEVDARWTDRNGFMRLSPDPDGKKTLDNENPTLFTSEYIYMLKRLGMLKGPVREEYKKRVTGMIDKLRLEPGLYNRTPLDNPGGSPFDRQFSWDEQTGLVTLDAAFDYELGYSKELVAYGRKHDYFYENRTWLKPNDHSRPVKKEVGVVPAVEFKFSSYRTPNIQEHFRIGAGEPPDALGQFWSRLHFWQSEKDPPGESSGKLLTHMRLGVLRDVTRATNQAIESYLAKMKEMYGDKPLHEIIKVYYRDENHPLRRLSAFLRGPQ